MVFKPAFGRDSVRFFRNPYKAYDKQRAKSPVERIENGLGMMPAWLITGYAEARAAFAHPGISKDIRRFQFIFHDAKVPNAIDESVANSMVGTDPPDHTRLRKLAVKAFTSGAIEHLHPRVEQVANDLLDAMEPLGHADLIRAFAGPLPIMIICDLLGIPESGRHHLRQWSNASFSEGSHQMRDEATGGLNEYLADLIKARRAEPADDLISRLIAARDDTDKFSDSELLSLVHVLLLTGHETTTVLISNAVCALLLHPDQLDALRQEPSLLPNAIEELLRYESPAAIATTRFTSEPVTINGTTIPENQIVLISPGAANHDPARFADPARLDIRRDASGHLAFGHGIHHCLGTQLARMETEIAVTALLKRFPQLSLDTRPRKLEWRRSRPIRGLRSLPVRW